MNATEVQVPVRIGRRDSGHIAGRLSVPDGARTVQLLVHGFTYDRSYWDFPYEPERYSYVHHATRAGYATLAIDRVGSGASTHPPGRLLTWKTAADTVHQVVLALRDGQLGTSFDRVILVGHSYGSVTNYRVAGRHGDVDALIATGIAHRVNVPALTWHVALQARPARRHPGLRAPDALYVTTKPGVRKWAFNHANSDPEVLRQDEQLRQTAGALELPTALVYLFSRISATTNIPVLTVNGDADPLFAGRWASDCRSDDTLTAFERRFYGPHATVESAVIGGAGHCLTIEPQAEQAYARMIDFCDRHVGTGATT